MSLDVNFWQRARINRQLLLNTCRERGLVGKQVTMKDLRALAAELEQGGHWPMSEMALKDVLAVARGSRDHFLRRRGTSAGFPSTKNGLPGQRGLPASRVAGKVVARRQERTEGFRVNLSTQAELRASGQVVMVEQVELKHYQNQKRIVTISTMPLSRPMQVIRFCCPVCDLNHEIPWPDGIEERTYLGHGLIQIRVTEETRQESRS